MKTFAYSVCWFLVAIGGSVEAWVFAPTAAAKTAAGKIAAGKTTRSPTPSPDKRRHEPLSPVAMVATAENKVTLPSTNHQQRVAVARAPTTRTARAALPTRAAESSSSSAANNNNSDGKNWLQNLLKKVIASLSMSSSFSSLLAVETNHETNELDVSVPLATQGVWTAYLDITGTGLLYYYNDRTGASQWNVPTTTFPVVHPLPPKLKCIARAQKRATLRRMQQLDDDMANRRVPQPAFFAMPQPADDDDDDETMYTDSLADMLAPYGGGSSQTTGSTTKKMLRTTDPGAVLASHGDWDAYRDDGTGYVYYFNRKTKITTWQAPSKHFPKINHGNHNDGDDESIACRPLASLGDWTAYFDAHDTCRIYYSNRVTGESQWTKPTKDFPTVRMNPTKQKRLWLAKLQLS